MAENLTTIVSSQSQSVTIHRDAPAVIIGERINPAGRKSLPKAMKAVDWGIVRQDALDQLAAGAVVLGVNAGIPGGEEPALLKAALHAVMEVTEAPICLDPANPHALKDERRSVDERNSETDVIGGNSGAKRRHAPNGP
ncbi:MAG: hypothetical protein QNJ61_17210 [Desulfobacterales bacterium]|nr:hypothetical protein [Desulfobacterales bacterium]